MGKIAILNDTHCGVRNSSEIFIDYQEKFYSQVFFPYLLKHNINRILHLGDYYDHRKYINYKALNANRHMFLDKLKENNITMDIIPGNHDVFYKNTNELCSLKELLGYYTGNVNIIMRPTDMMYDNLSIALVPWINETNHDETMRFIESTKSKVMCGHFELAGFPLMRGVYNTKGPSGDDIHKDKFKMILSGHFHTKSRLDNIQYLGSQMEFTWSDESDKKYFHILDTETHLLNKVHNPITLFKKIKYCDKTTDYSPEKYDVSDCKDKFVKIVVISNKKDPYVYDKFIDRINQVGTHGLKIAETFEEFTADNVAAAMMVEDTPTLLNDYVDDVITDLDKHRIKETMHSIYIEAQSLGTI